MGEGPNPSPRRLVPNASITALVLLATAAGTVATGHARAATDRDRDGLPDRWERRHGISTRHNSARRDPDRDGLRNRTEYRHRLNPRRVDTDRDGLRDDYELYRSNTSPRRRDSDGDGVSDGREVRLGRDPIDTDTRRATTEPSRVLHVSTAGSDAGIGTVTRPFSSLHRALKASVGGELILVAPGSYPELIDSRERTASVTIRAAGRARPRIAGARLLGSQRLRLERLAFTERVTISQHGARGGRQPARDITITGSDVTTGGGKSCVQIRSGTRGVELLNNHIHGCQHGISGPGHTTRSSGIVIRGNVLENFWADGIAFGHWTDVVIDQNVIRNMHRRRGSNEHNDGIQIFGDSERVRITSNRIHHSDGQLVLIQDPVGGKNDDVLLENNLIHSAGAYAVQVIGSTDVRVVNNTVWDSRWGALLIRRGGSGVVPTDAVVVNNILKSFTTLDGASTRARRNNLILKRPRGGFAPHELVGVNPRFRDARSGDYTLRASSPARAAADAAYAPAFDLTGRTRPRRASLGALDVRRRR